MENVTSLIPMPRTLLQMLAVFRLETMDLVSTAPMDTSSRREPARLGWSTVRSTTLTWLARSAQFSTRWSSTSANTTFSWDAKSNNQITPVLSVTSPLCSKTINVLSRSAKLTMIMAVSRVSAAITLAKQGHAWRCRKDVWSTTEECALNACLTTSSKAAPASLMDASSTRTNSAIPARATIHWKTVGATSRIACSGMKTDAHSANKAST